MPPAMRFPDVQALLVDALEELAGVGNTGIETPEDLEVNLPFVRVRRIAGQSDRVTDYSTITVDVFTLFYGQSESLAENIRQWLCGPPPPIARLDYVDCTSAPQELPWAKASPVRRFGAMYRVEARRHAA